MEKECSALIKCSICKTDVPERQGGYYNMEFTCNPCLAKVDLSDLEEDDYFTCDHCNKKAFLGAYVAEYNKHLCNVCLAAFLEVMKKRANS